MTSLAGKILIANLGGTCELRMKPKCFYTEMKVGALDKQMIIFLDFFERCTFQVIEKVYFILVGDELLIGWTIFIFHNCHGNSKKFIPNYNYSKLG